MMLEGKTAIVTGAAQGLGLAIAKHFCGEGANVAMVDRNAEKLQTEAAAISGIGKILAITANLSEAAEVSAMTDQVIDGFGAIDALINNAGGSGSEQATDIEDVTEEIWDHVVGINLKSAFLCCQAAAPHMKARRYGRIVNFSSGIAKGIGQPQATGGAVLPYASSKAGILGLTYTLAKMLAPHNILVNAIVPGFMLTEEGTRVRAWYDGLDDQARRALNARNSMGRPGSPEEVASLAAFLASDSCGYISGAAIDINGAG